MIRAELDKYYGVHQVLKRAKLEVEGGTVHALVGENGAGKSTLVKIIAGVVRGDGGTLVVGAKRADVPRWTRTAARAAGIGIVQQHGAFAGTLSVVENAVLGVEPRRNVVLELAPTAKALKELGDRIGLHVDPWARVDRLSLGAAQRAEIVAALHLGAKLLVLDEPTAVLAPIEVDGLLATLRTLAATGTTIVLVTHKLDEVRQVADAVTVLRAGVTTATFGKDAASADIARAMVGAELPRTTQVAPPPVDAKPALAIEQLSVGDALREVRLDVRVGELLGVAGVDGNGQRELALAIAGLVPHGGRVVIGSRDVTRASPRARLAAGLAHVPEDRQHGGLVLDASVADNLALGRADVTGKFRVDRRRVAMHADLEISALDIRPPERTAIARALSGGNQQKIVIGRELSRPHLAAVIASQPTRGVDLGAVARIHDRLRAAATSGAGVLVISADLDELLALCHRIVVLLRGKLVGEVAGEALRAPDARARIVGMMTGANAE
jgi:simple sugar transport system ATP-binding protein